MTILISICIWHAIVPKLGLDDADSEEADKIALGVLGAIYLVFHVFFGFWISCAVSIYLKKKEKEKNFSIRSYPNLSFE